MKFVLKKDSFNNKQKTHIDENNICRHALLVSNINNELTIQEAQIKLEQVYKYMLAQIQNFHPLYQDKVLKFETEALVVQMVNDFDFLTQKQKQIEKNGLKNDYYKSQQKNDKNYTKEVKDRSYCCCFGKKYQVTQQHYFQRKKEVNI